jgi:hypothetical protein
MMTAEDRVKTVADFGFTDRQARFLVMVMRHAGICVPRQYAAFAGTAYGRRVNALFDRLVERRYATICGCVHNRARLYHVRHHALYHATRRSGRSSPARCPPRRSASSDGILKSVDWRPRSERACRVMPGSDASNRPSTRPVIACCSGVGWRTVTKL